MLRQSPPAVVALLYSRVVLILCCRCADDPDFDRSTRDGGMAEQTSENQSADWSSKSLLEKLRELNRTGVTSTLKQVDEQYLAKFFGADLEMVEVSSGPGGGQHAVS